MSSIFYLSSIILPGLLLPILIFFFALNTSSLISIVIKIKHQKIGTFIQLRRMVSNVLVVVRSPIKSFIYKVDSEEMIESES